MYETDKDLQALQQLLDASYARAGSHLRSIWGEETRLDAAALSAERSARFRHIRSNPAVSGAVTRGLETFLVIVHGHAVETDPRGPEAGGFAAYPREVYDFNWDAAHPTAPYARIDARTMLAFRRR